MAPALTEPISPTEKLNSSVSTTTTTATRSTRKLETATSIKANNNNNLIKQTPQLREKRNCNNNNSITVVQAPTSSIRLTRSRDTQQQRNLSSPNCKEQPAAPKKSPFKISSSDNKNNEQMGLSTAVLDNKNKLISENTATTELADTNRVEKASQEDTSTAQLLADLTNEAITADICLRNQLKDVNLVKVSEGSASPLQRESEIVVIKAIAASPNTSIDTAHMETQCNESESNTATPIQDSLKTKYEQPLETDTLETTQKEDKSKSKDHESSLSLPTITQQKPTDDDIVQDEGTHTDEKHQHIVQCPESINVEMEKATTFTAAEEEASLCPQESESAGSPDVDAEIKKEERDTSKPEILSVQELPPVNTDSTMTASEVEDNLEERLSQLDGTAIDSPPPNNDPNDKDSLMKTAHNMGMAAATTPPRTPTHQQQTLTQEIQQIQQQLQNTPPTPVSQQVQAHLMQHQHQQQQQNCFTPQSTTSSVNTVGSGNIPPSFIKESEGGELEDQDIEEVFKVLKGFEGGTSADLNVCDLNVLFNEVYMKMNETEMNGNPVGGVVSQGHVSVTPNPSIQLVKPTELEEGQREIEKRQQQMHRKVDFLMRRLRKLQSRYMCKHTSEEIAGLFEWSSRHIAKGNVVTPARPDSETANSEQVSQEANKYFLKVIASRPPATEWKQEQEEIVPATQITSLLRKIEAVANAQQHCITPATNMLQIATTKKSKKALLEAQNAAASSGSKNLSASTLAEDRVAENIVVSTLDENVTNELNQVAGLLQSEMCEVQRAIDSDATESSSGGESADEMVTYNNQQQQTLPITKRAAWRYSRDRAAIASRWSWLLSQISDLEIKIRQHSELHQEIVRSKGPVTSDLTENGVKFEAKIGGVETGKEDVEGSCRTRGFLTAQFRKRKLIQTTNIHTISKKAARPSTIKCGCQWPLHPCALCTGRSDPTAPRDLPDTMMMSDRISLLDSGYHPVLSFRENVNNALHFEAIAKQPEWQQRVMRCQAKNIAKNVWKAEREAAGGHSSKKLGADVPTKRRYVKKKDREDKTGASGSGTTTGSNPSGQARSTTVAVESAAANSVQMITTSATLLDGSLATTTSSSTTPIVANKPLGKSVKSRQQCQILSDVILKEPAILPSPLRSSVNATNAPPIIASTMMNSIHQTSDCHPISYDPYNLNQTHSSSISNTSSKSNKNRKLSSASTAAVNSHHYNQHHNNNHLYNGETNFLHNHDWSTAAGSGGGVQDGIIARSRTSSPTHGSSYYSKNERSFDRKNRVSYDIDNIVIPYSVAAATRVEILPYKEIPTPKWRVINLNGEESDNVDIFEFEKSDVTTSNGIFSISNKLNILDSTNHKEKLFEWVEKVESSVTTNKSNDTDSNKTTVKGDQQKKTTAAKEGNCDENGTHEFNENCQDHEEVKEPDEKKLKIEPSVIKFQGTQAMFDKKCEVNTEQLDEDISDDAMVLRHERALTEERRKFQTYLKFPWSTRSRANRRIDSRAESSGANTPDPSSPAPQTPSVGGGDQESIPSPSTPSTPLNILDTISEAGDNSTSFLGVGFMSSQSSKRQERRRTTSTKRDLERRSSTPDSKELIPPYEPMKFPLSDEQFDELMSAMPSEHNEESKRFDECYLPGGGTRPHTRSAGNTSKRSSRSSTVCGGERRVKGSLKNSSVDDVNIMMTLENGTDSLYDEEYDDYPKHHLAPNDDHLTADNCVDSGGIDGYGDEYDDCRQHKHRNDDSDGESTETEPFQDDDPNDPEWRGEGEDRSRKKI